MYLDEQNPRLQPETPPNKQEAEIYKRTFRTFQKVLENQLTPKFKVEDTIKTAAFIRKQTKPLKK